MEVVTAPGFVGELEFAQHEPLRRFTAQPSGGAVAAARLPADLFMKLVLAPVRSSKPTTMCVLVLIATWYRDPARRMTQRST